ncbi:MAG TPA: hypothetical protein VJN18_32240 [Polyangiaceae bacterium]|nr:hypothetical protein [Polyangiaceae bacterium]
MSQLDLTPAELRNRYSAADLAAILRRYRLPVSNEAEMQGAVEKALQREAVPYRREVVQGGDRIDFVVARVGIELKVKGSVATVTRQLFRYARWEDLNELLVVTSVGQHLGLPRSLNGKPIVVHVPRGRF